MLAGLLTLYLCACDADEGQDGPHKAYFLLKTDSGQIERFDLGSYDRMTDCVSIIKYETVEGRPDNLIGAFCLNEDEYTLTDKFIEN